MAKRTRPEPQTKSDDSKTAELYAYFKETTKCDDVAAALLVLSHAIAESGRDLASDLKYGLEYCMQTENLRVDVGGDIKTRVSADQEEGS